MNAEKSPVRTHRQIDIDRTIRESGNPGAVADAVRGFRMSGANGAGTPLNRNMNNVDNLQRGRTALGKQPCGK